MDGEFINRVKTNEREYCSGDYAIGRYGCILDNIEPLDTPIYVNGQLGIWNYPKNSNK